MPLVGVNPGIRSERKPTTFENVIMGLDASARILGLGLTGIDLYNKIKERGLAQESLGLKKQEVALSEAERFEPAKESEVGAVKLPESQVFKDQYVKPRAPKQTELDKLVMLEKARTLSQPQLTPAQKAVDEQFAKDYNEFVSQGGYADIQKNIDQLKSVSQRLKQTNSATGPLIGLVPKTLRDVVTPEGASMQDAVEEVVQRNMRLILGPQFTEKEGTRLIERAYNPKMGEQENARRVDRLLNQIERAAKAKTDAARYYETRGTLQGYQGKLINSIDDIFPQTKEEIKSSPAPSLPQIGQEYKGHIYLGGDPSNPQSWRAK